MAADDKKVVAGPRSVLTYLSVHFRRGASLINH